MLLSMNRLIFAPGSASDTLLNSGASLSELVYLVVPID